MARGVNKVILVGNLGQDPEVRYMPNGNGVANITLATSDSYKDKNTGQMVDKTEWHKIVFFGKLAEIVGEYCRKGSQIYVEGKLQTRKWTDQQGVERYTTEIVVDGFTGQMQMLGSRTGGQSQGGQSQGGQPQNNQYQGNQPQNNQYQGNQPQNNQYQGNQPQNNQYQGNQAQGGQGQNNQGSASNPSTGPAQGGFAPKPSAGGPNTGEPTVDFDDDIPF